MNITADVDRDGIVDARADERGEDTWTAQRGAIFLANTDSDQDSGAPDHADEIVNGPDDLSDLAIIRLSRIPDLPAEARVAITVDPASRGRVRIFVLDGDGRYMPLLGPAPGEGAGESPVALLDPAQVRAADIELRIEALSYTDGGWGGETLVTATVAAATGLEESDSVRLRVAPLLLLSNLHRGTTLYVREYPGENDRFLAQLQAAVPAAGSELEIVPAGEPYRPNNVWMQDTMEIGYSEMPGVRMSVVLAANRNRPLDEFARQGLLGPDYGWLRCGAFRPELLERGRGNRWLDWYGNLEVTPPLPGYPFGRVYYGANGEESLNPEIVAMLDAQGLQGPALRLDTGWLLIKHVDEMVAFLPSGDPAHPHKMMVPDAGAMLDLLDTWIAEGRGMHAILQPFEGRTTVADLASSGDLIEHNRRLQRDRIAPNVELLMAELGLRRDDVIPIPALFEERGGALFPNMVNSVVLNGHLLVSDPHGPEIDGVDLLQQHVRDLLADLPLEVHFLDDRLYHRWGGNTHCATNVRRLGPDGHWWEVGS